MSETITTTTAREGIQTLGTVGTEPVGWDGCEDMPEAYGHACAELTAETLTRASMLVLGALGDTDLVYMEGDEVCVGLVTPLPSQLIDVTTEDLEESVEVMGETLPDIYLTAAMAARAVTGAEGVRCDALTFCLEPSQRRMRVCHVRGVCRM
ncbi:MAG: hypothetical protein IKG18_18125 [Atopobiaceae bacterium]|nr:hypothetical protein [Atopobiaceae bacterium]MBR3316041.1 hypothetical protein [Atopobiaceae bacterium]